MVGLEFLTKFEKPALILGFVYIFTDVVIKILNAGMLFYATGNARPLMDSTIGRMLIADNGIRVSVNILTSPGANGLSEIFVSYLKTEIIKKLILLVIYGYILFKVYSFIISIFGFTQERLRYEALGFKLVVYAIGLLFVIGALGASELIYVKNVHDEFVIPFGGVGNLIINGKQIIQTTGQPTPLSFNEFGLLQGIEVGINATAQAINSTIANVNLSNFNLTSG